MRTVVLTRPEGQNEALVRIVRQAGHKAIVIPWLCITSTWKKEERSTWWNEEALSYATIMFVSAAAVHAALPQSITWPAGIWAVAPGPGTAQALELAGVPPQWIRAPETQFDSEGIWRECADCFLPDMNIMIFRGQSGRSWLGDRAIQAQCSVEYKSVYCRLPCMDAAEKVMALWQSQQVDALVLTNSEAIRSVGAQLSQSLWENVKIFVPHARIEETAKYRGARDVVLTPGGDEGLGSALQEWLENSDPVV